MKVHRYFKSKTLWIIVSLLLVYLSVFTMAETEFVLVTQFGRPVAQYDSAGLKLKWPFQSITRIDKRLHLYNPRPSEYLTRDKKNLLVENYVCWQVEDPLLFLRTVGDNSSAEMRLHDIVWSLASAELGRTALSDLISTDTEHVQVGSIMRTVTEQCRMIVKTRYGISIAAVDIKRLNLPAQNRESVFARMRAERERIAKQYRAEGEEEARKIRAEADRAAEEILSNAYKEAEIVRGKGDAESTRIYGKAFSRDPQFYQMVRTLEAYRKILDDKTTAVLSADSELLKLLTAGTNGKLVK